MHTNVCTVWGLNPRLLNRRVSGPLRQIDFRRRKIALIRVESILLLHLSPFYIVLFRYHFKFRSKAEHFAISNRKLEQA
jgi:hypothetical protein